MLSREFGFCSPYDIWIDRANRQRKQFTTDDLDQSIFQRGILQPLIITRTFELKAGERRLTSAIKMGLTEVPYRFIDTLDTVELQIIELEENLKRVDLHWKDETAAVSNIHKLYLEKDPNWTQNRTADMLGLSKDILAIYLRVARDLDSPKVSGATSYRSAYNLLVRVDERKIGDAMADILEAGNLVIVGGAGSPQSGAAAIPPQPAGTPLNADHGRVGLLVPTSTTTPNVAPAPIPSPAESILNAILQESFLTWAPLYKGPKFNFLHCDFPYGINAFDGSQGASGANSSANMDLAATQAQLYDDSPEKYWTLLKCLCENLDKVMSPTGHMVFWFSMHYYHDTLQFFKAKAPSLTFNTTPLIWLKSDNRGVISDAQRSPRNIYETALMASREDRKIIRSTSNAYSCPTDKSFHHSTKPEPMLRYFFQMFVDENSRVLDPTCGSGSALRAAESLGAKQILGLEMDPEHCENARKALRHFRVLRKASSI